MEGALSIVDLYDVTPRFVETVGRHVRVAYINPPKEWIPENDKFSRNVAFNRGGALEVFASEKDAVDWLLNGRKDDLPCDESPTSSTNE